MSSQRVGGALADVLQDGLHLASPAALGSYLGHGKWQRAAHLDFISAKLVDAAVGRCPRLMIHCPPQHGKSSLVSHWFPTWFLALMPDRYVILSSYAADFAATWGRKVRNTLAEYWPDLGVTVAEDSRAAHRWNTREGGGMVTAGVGGPITGRPAHVFIIDDPVKDGQEALSDTVQRRSWEWYKSTAVTRLRPRGAVIIVQTRWDEDDLSGKLLQAQKGGPGTEGYDEWEVVSLPAVADGPGDALDRKPGEALWPDVYDIKTLEDKEAAVGPHWWAAEYQQRPTPLGGDLIKEHWWNYWVPKGTLADWPAIIMGGRQCRIVELPTLMAKVQSWDMNFRDSIREIEEGREPDPVAGHVWGRTDADLFLLDRFHNRVGLNETIHAVREMSVRNPEAKTKLVEDTANGPAVMARLQRELGGFIPVTPRGSKVMRAIGTGKTEADRGARALSFAASVQSGNAYLPHPALRSWVVEFRTNLGNFPKGGKDDTDAASQAWAHLTSPMWRDVDRQHREALANGRIATTTRDILRQRFAEAARYERENPTPQPNRYRRLRWMRR